MTTEYIPTPTQEAILKHAIDCTGCRVEFIPPQIRGGARNKVLENLLAYGLIEPNPVRPTQFIVTAAGCTAVGREVPADTTSTPTQEENAPQAATPADEGAKSTTPQHATARSRSAKKAEERPIVHLDAIRPPSGSGWTAPSAEPQMPRHNSKQAQVIAMLEQGATVAEICEATGWQKHTVRAFFAGALKKKGLTLTSSKTLTADGGWERTYRIDHAAT